MTVPFVSVHRSVATLGKFIENVKLQPHNGIVFQEKSDVRQTENFWNIELPIDIFQFENNVREVSRILDKILKTCKDAHYTHFLNCVENANYAKEKALRQLKEIAILRGNKVEIKDKSNKKNIIKRDLQHPILPLGGDLLHLLFGTARFQDLEKFNHHLDRLYATSNSLIDFSKQQTKFLSNLVNNYTEIKEFTKRMHNRLEDLNHDYNLRYLQERELQVLRDITETFEIKLNAIKSALIQHRFSSDLVKPDILLNQLREINDHLPDGKVLPFVYTLDYYINIPVQSNIVGHLLILNLRIPIISNEVGKLFEIHALPFEIQNHRALAYIKSNFEYIMIFKEYYIYLKNLASCIKLEHSFVCHSTEPLRKINSEGDCIFNLYKNITMNLKQCKQQIHIAHLKDNALIKWERNSWFYSFAKNVSEKVSVSCGDELEVQTLTNTGIIKITEGCNVEMKNLMFKTEKDTGKSTMNITENFDLHNKLIEFLKNNLSNIVQHETNIIDISINDEDLKKISLNVNELEHINRNMLPTEIRQIIPRNSWSVTLLYYLCSFIASYIVFSALIKYIIKKYTRSDNIETKMKRSVSFKTGVDEIIFNPPLVEILI